MPRPPKFPDQAIARVRKELKLTREQLAKRTGISVYSLRAIERKDYGLQPDVAKKISLVTRVSVGSLLRNDDVLLDQFGQPFKAASGGKKFHRDFRANRDSAEQLFAIVMDEIPKKERGQEAFYHEFNTWIAELANRFGLKRKILDRVYRLARDEGISFLVPEGLLLGNAEERRRWRQEHFNALFPLDETGKPRDSALTKRWAAIAALEEREFAAAYPRQSTQLVELQDRKRSRKLSESESQRLGKLQSFRAKLGFKTYEQADSWRSAAALCLKNCIPIPHLR